jgi:hypothetical protein
MTEHGYVAGLEQRGDGGSVVNGQCALVHERRA